MWGCSAPPSQSPAGPSGEVIRERQWRCESLRVALPLITRFPLALPLSQPLEPFAPEIQEWFYKRLRPTGIYTPVGRWTGAPTTELWLIEHLSVEGSTYYAILADTGCTIRDTVVWAYQYVSLDTLENKLERGTAQIDQAGNCVMTQETDYTIFRGEQPKTYTARRTLHCQVDWAGQRFRCL